jgi:hypothetical protein
MADRDRLRVGSDADALAVSKPDPSPNTLPGRMVRGSSQLRCTDPDPGADTNSTANIFTVAALDDRDQQLLDIRTRQYSRSR